MVVHKDTQGREDYHDRGAKTLLNGLQLAAGQSTDQDLNAAIDNIAYHPNVAPFISKQLIQHLVTSNPSPAYVQRIAAVFAANQTSPTQLFEVVRAILLDDEARGDAKEPARSPDYGKLREPVQLITNVLRAFNATSDGVLDSLNVGGSAIGSADMGQDVFNAPSVFSFYPPTARVPGGKRPRPSIRLILIFIFDQTRKFRQPRHLFNHSRRAAESACWNIRRPLGLGSIGREPGRFNR
jgi:uncharacterized protein (DUF1800 family)